MSSNDLTTFLFGAGVGSVVSVAILFQAWFALGLTLIFFSICGIVAIWVKEK